MKRILSVLLCLCVTLPVLAARRSGQLPRTANTFVAMDSSLTGGANGTRWLGPTSTLYKIRNGQTLSVGVSAPDSGLSDEELGEVVRFYYQSWFENARKHIRQQHREKEFAWAMDILNPNNIKISVDGQRGRDLNFSWVPASQIKGHLAGDRISGTEAGGYVTCPLQTLNKSKSSICLHEVGHTLGLGEQYYGNSGRNSEIGSQRMDPNGMMGSGDSRQFSDDDATGLLVLLSLTYPESNRPRVRSLKPGSSEVFVNGISTENGPVSIVQDRNDKTLFFVTRGNSQQDSRKFRINMRTKLEDFKNMEMDKQQPPETDKLQRPVYAKGKHGEEFYFAYAAADDNYGPKKILIVKGGKVLFYLVNEYDNRSSMNKLNQHSLTFGTNDRDMVIVSWFAGQGKGAPEGIQWWQEELKNGSVVQGKTRNCKYNISKNGEMNTQRPGTGCQEKGKEQDSKSAANEQTFRQKLLRWKEYAIPWLERDVGEWGRSHIDW